MVPAQPHNRFFTRIGISYDDRATQNLAFVHGAVRMSAFNAVEEVCEFIRASAWSKANVSKGERGNARDGTHMRDNIAVSVEETKSGVVGKIGIDLDNVPYAHHQEFGPRGKPFMRPALDEGRSFAREMLAGRMREALGVQSRVRPFTRFYRGRP